MDCIELFENAPLDSTRAACIDRAAPECACEAHKVSRYCDKPVAQEEVLVRLVMDPTHTFTEDGNTRIKSALFSDASSFGSSCLRNERASPDEYHLTIEEMLKANAIAADGSRKALHGIVLVPVSKIKELQHKFEEKGKVTEYATAFGVYATGLEGRPNHADIITNKVSSISRSKANRAEINLMKAVSESFLSTEDFADRVDLRQWSRTEIERKANAVRERENSAT